MRHLHQIDEVDILRFLAQHIADRRDGAGKRQAGLKSLAEALKSEFNLENDVSTVSRRIDELWKSGALVEWADYNSLWRGECQKGEQEDLIRDFKLQEAIVVKADIRHPDPNETKLHYALSNEAADEARKRDLYRNIRHLAIGAGRATTRYAESIMNRPPHAANLTISPISGRLWVGDIWKLQDEADAESHLEAPLDADFSALFIGRGLHQARRQNIRLSQVSHFAYTEDTEKAKRVTSVRCAFKMDEGWNWGLNPPDRIIFGAASTDSPEHRVSKFVDRCLAHSVKASVPESIKKHFTDVMNLVKTLQLPPVADFSVPLFATVPLPDETNAYNLDAKAYRRVAETLKSLNSKTVAISFKHLQSTVRAGGFTQLIAGGKTKHRLIWSLLLPGVLGSGQVVNSVCTDLASAQTLHGALKSLNTNPDLRKRYEALIEVIF